MFAYRLARDLGRVDVDELQESLTPEQMREWMAAYMTGCLDDHWQQTAALAATMVNLQRALLSSISGKKMQASDMVQPDAFLPQLPGDEKQTATDDSVFAFERTLAARFGG